MEKRGVSSIVIVMMLILLSIIAIMIIFALVLPIFNKSDTDTSNVRIFSAIDEKSICISPTIFQLEVERKSGEGDIEGLYFVLSNATNTTNYTVLQPVKLNERIRVTIPLTAIDISSPQSLEVYSIIKTKKGNILGDVKDTYDVKGTELPCAPETGFNINVLSPIENQAYPSGPIDFKISTNKQSQSCTTSIDSTPDRNLASLNPPADTSFSITDATLLTGQHTASFTCKSTGGEDTSTKLIPFSIAAPLIPIPIGCGIINSPGNYIIQGPLMSPGTCIFITANNVFLDGNGFSITYGQDGIDFSHGIEVENVTNIEIKNAVLYEGNDIGNNKHAILLLNVTTANIHDNTMILNNSMGNTNSSSGVYLFLSHQVTVENNFINGTGPANTGISLQATNNSNIKGNQINLSGDDNGYGIFLKLGFFNNIENNIINTIGDESFGIYLTYSESNTLKGNQINTPGTNSIVLLGDTDADFTTNTIPQSNKAEGNPINYNTGPTCKNLDIQQDFRNYGEVIYADCDNIKIRDSQFNLDGINFFRTINSKIERNTFTNSKGYSVFLYSNATNNTVANNTIDTTSKYGHAVYIHSSPNNTVVNNTIATHEEQSKGVFVAFSPLINISRNRITTDKINSHGIHLYLSNAATIEANSIAAPGTDDPIYGAFIEFSNNTQIRKNAIVTGGSTSYGIYLRYSTADTLTENAVNTSKTNSIVIRGIKGTTGTGNAQGFGHTIDTSNKVEDGQVDYYDGDANSGTCKSINNQDLSSHGEVIIANCAGGSGIRNSKFAKDSLNLFSATNVNIHDNNIDTSKGYGIFLFSSSSSNTIQHHRNSGNRIRTTGSGSLSAVRMQESSGNNIVDDNSIDASGEGIYASSSTNNIQKNDIIASSRGIYISGQGNVIHDTGSQPIVSSNEHIYIAAGSNNVFYNLDSSYKIYFGANGRDNVVLTGTVDVAKVIIGSSATGYLHLRPGVATNTGSAPTFQGTSSIPRLTIDAHTVDITAGPSTPNIKDATNENWYPGINDPILVYLGQQYYKQGSSRINANDYTICGSSHTITSDTSFSC